jgi:hypothetical protein
MILITGKLIHHPWETILEYHLHKHLNLSPHLYNISSHSSVSFQELSNFRKATKHDATVYETFKDEQYFEAFWRVFKATAKAQGLANVVDPQYTPPTGDPHAIKLFTEQKIFLYSVLVKVIQTDQG